MALDLPCREPTGVERDHLVVETGQPALPFLHQLRIEIAVAVARNFDLQLARSGQHVLAGGAVTRVPAATAFRSVFLVTKMRGELAFQRALHETLGQALEDSLLAKNLLRSLALQHLIEELIDFVFFGHGLPPCIRKFTPWPFTQNSLQSLPRRPPAIARPRSRRSSRPVRA